VIIALKILLTSVPVASVDRLYQTETSAAEKKNSTIGQECFSSLPLFSIENEITNIEIITICESTSERVRKIL